jgi:hypothetical protein
MSLVSLTNFERFFDRAMPALLLVLSLTAAVALAAVAL